MLTTPAETNERAASEQPLDALTALSEGLQHDARNPLNAISIHVEVLAERLRRESGGALPETYEKTIRALREQVKRLDTLLASFGDFLSPRPSEEVVVDLSGLTLKGLEVLGYEARRKRLRLKRGVEAGLKVRGDSVRLHHAVLGALLRGIASTPAGGELSVGLGREEGEGVLRVEESGQANGVLELRFPLG